MLLNEATYNQILAADLEKAAPPGETCLQPWGAGPFSKMYSTLVTVKPGNF